MQCRLQNLFNAVLSADYVVTSSMANIGLSVSLPIVGTYMIAGNVRARFMLNGSVGQSSYISTRLYDSTNSVVFLEQLEFAYLLRQATGGFSVDLYIGLGPVGPNVLHGDGSNHDPASSCIH